MKPTPDARSARVPDPRGFAIGLAAAGNSMGAMLTTFPIDAMLRASGLRATLTIYGLALGAVGGLMATSNFANFARDFGVAGASVLGLAALTIDRLLNGFTRRSGCRARWTC